MNRISIFLLLLIMKMAMHSFAIDDSSCIITCDENQFSASCNTSTTLVSTTTLNASDPTALPVAMEFTTPAVLASSKYSSTIVPSLSTLSTIIELCRKNHYLDSKYCGYGGTYYTALQNVNNNVFQFTLNENDTLLLKLIQAWYDYIINKSFVKDQTSKQDVFVIDAAASSASNSIMSTNLSVDTLSAQQCVLQAQKSCLDSAISCLNDQIFESNQELAIARQDAFTAFSNSDLFIRGRLGKITNTSPISYQLVASDGTILDTIIAGQTSLNIFALSDYADDQQGSMFKLVPYDGVNQVGQDGSGEALSYGGTFTILCNSVGLNQPGNPYGYAESVSVTRVYPSGATRAHVVDISSLVEDEQYWEFNITINPLPGHTQFVYPRISMVSNCTETFNVENDFPEILDAVMETNILINSSNTGLNTYPGLENTTYWSDVLA